MSALSDIKSIALSVEKSHYMQEKTILAKELGVSVEEVCESMLLFSESNVHIVASSVVRPFILNFGRYFRFEVSAERWPTIGEVESTLKNNFSGYVHPQTLKKLSSDYRLRKVASEIENWYQAMISRVGTLKESERLMSRVGILEGYRTYLRTSVYGRDTHLILKEIVSVREELEELKKLVRESEK